MSSDATLVPILLGVAGFVLLFAWMWRAVKPVSNNSEDSESASDGTSAENKQSRLVHNALLAEHTLSLIQLVPKNPFSASLRDAIIAVYRSSGFPKYSADTVAHDFNNLSRILQLNVVAMALKELGRKPILFGADWKPARVAFSGDMAHHLVSQIETRLSQKFGVPIKLENGKFAMRDWGIEDLKFHQPATSNNTDATTQFDDLIPGLTAPAVVGGSYVRSYLSKDYIATISEDNESLGPISYKYVMVVAEKDETSPVMFVTAESNQMLPAMIEMLSNETKDYFGGELSDDLVLGVFDANGHHNLGPDKAISSLEGFADVALRVVRDWLGVADEFQEIKTNRATGFGPVMEQAQDHLFETFGVKEPSDAQKLKASFYLCVSGIAVLNDAGGGATPDVIDKLVADTSVLVKPLSVHAKDLANSPEQLASILSQIPSGATGSTRLNGLAAFEAMYFSLGQDLVNDMARHKQGPLGIFGYAAYVVADGVFGEGAARENFLKVSENLVRFVEGLVDAA